MTAKLTVIAGCMFSGKSSELIRRLVRAQYAKKDVLLVRPAIDNRTDLSEARTRLGITFPSIAVPEDAVNMTDKIGQQITVWPNVIGIDEAQFFGEEILFEVLGLQDWYSIEEVIVAGLNTDFRGMPFGSMPQLMAFADEVVTVTAICTVCGAEATRTQRLIDGKPASALSPQIIVGDSETYEARCRNHWKLGYD
jgi:thymidine kinase